MNESNTWVLLGSGQEEADKVGVGWKREREEKTRLMPHPKFTRLFRSSVLDMSICEMIWAPEEELLSFFKGGFIAGATCEG